jgi:uncharacterized protein YyaL (SSP411 family)
MPAEDRALFDRLGARVEAVYDTARGYSTRDGMPSESAVELALRNAMVQPEGEWTAHADRTMEWIFTLYDSSMTGFYHGMDDAKVGSSSYSKRTDSNARRFELLMDSYRLTGDEDHLRVARSCYGYFQRVLAEGRAGFVWGQVGDRQLYPEPNGLAIRAYMQWAALTKDRRPRDYALRSLDVAWTNTWRPMGGFWRRDFLEEIPKSAQLVDQVAMGRALVVSARVAGRPQDTERAIQVGQLVLDWFVDPETGVFRSSATPKKSGGVKMSGRDALENALAVRFMAELSHLTGDPRWAAAGRRALPAFEKDFEDMKLVAADWALAVRAFSVNELPDAAEWTPVVENAEPAAKPRPKSNRYRTGAR